MLVLRSRKARKTKERKTRARKTECGSRRFRCRWVIITTITIITAASSFASGLATPAIITTIIITIIITTEAMEGQRGVRLDAPLLFSFTGFSFADLAFCRTEQMAVCAVEDGVGFRGPR
jgi:hypothetical protein